MSSAADLAPFAHSLRVDAQFLIPEGFVDLTLRGLSGRAWWPLDVDARERSMAQGPRDLSAMMPEGRADALEALESLLDALAPEDCDRPLIVGGFSQGAMLACDLALRSTRPLVGVVMLSGARICADEWRTLYAHRQGLPVFMSHGTRDPDLSFDAALALSEDLRLAGWDVTFIPFDGGHEVPLVVWRSLKKWLSALAVGNRP